MAIYRFLSYLSDDPDHPDLWDGSFVADEVHALDGDDIVHAGGGDDLVWGGYGNDHVYGGTGNDELHGDADWGERTIQGLRPDNGDDTLFGNEGNDTLDGGYGEDRLFGGSVESADDVAHGLGADTLRGGNDDDLLYAIEGGVRSVAIDSVADARAVDAGDILDGGAGDDTFFIEHDFTGTMQIAGGTEIDTLTFDRDEFDSFILRGPNVVNFVDLQAQVGTTPLGSHIAIQTVENIVGDGYNDIFRGDDGVNELDGMGGNDRLEGRGGGDTLDGGDGTDVADYSSSLGAVDVDLTRATQIGGHAQDDVLLNIEDVDGSRYYGDTLRGDSHANYLFGNGGNDTLEGRGGADTIDGGLNTDTASYEHSGAAVNVRLAEPLTGAASQASGGDAAGDVLMSIENLTGSRFGDTLTGNSSGNVIDGGDGADIMAGAAGNDVYFVDTADHYVIVNPFTHQMAFVAGDQVIEQANAGTDQVNSSVSFTLSANVENLNLLAGAVNGTGNDLDNRITGNSADNTLNGANGNDTLIGGGGEDHLNGGSNDDTYFVDSVGDVVFEFEDDGFDTVNVGGTVVDYAMVAHTEVLNLNAGLTATGNGLANTMNGNAAGNTLEGFGGADTLNGNGGDDTLIGDAGNDTFAGGTGNDILTGGADADTFVFNTSLNALTNVDRITDFSHVDDTIALDDNIFHALSGKLTADEFVIGSAAQDANDHIIYNSQTGALSYDADGVGGAAAVQFASLGVKLPLDHTDFLIL